ncbi:MAG: NFACT family protein [Candidatus Melainabacteria bacterium]|nr:NFACT family protein [Candidatus Melainabacteria bacterium]
MQPFDALSIRAVLQEAKPLIINRKVDKVFQLGRDEVLISLRSKGGSVSLFLSAQSVYGRMCLVRTPTSSDAQEKQPKDRNITERYQSKHGAGAPPNFCLVMRKHLTGATLIGVEQLPGERIIDFIFSSTDEVGTTSLKILTAEIMGRHSNLVFWDKATEKILVPSHVVTREMSRQREVLPGLKYERPPGQERQSVFAASEEDLRKKFQTLKEMFAHDQDSNSALQLSEIAAKSQSETNERNSLKNPGAAMTLTPGTTDSVPPMPVTYEQWLLASFTGLGKHLSEEVILGSGVDNIIANSINQPETLEKIVQQVRQLQFPNQYKPAIKADLSRYSILGWYSDQENEEVWKKYVSVNDMIEEYFRALEAREQFIQLREKIKAEVAAESSRLETRKQVAQAHMSAQGELDRLKQSGDNILSNLHLIKPGQTTLVVPDWTHEDGRDLSIALNANLSAVQNAQGLYRQYAKLRSRQGAAQSTYDEVTNRLTYLDQVRTATESAKDIAELHRVKDMLSGRKAQHNQGSKTDSKQNQKIGQSKPGGARSGTGGKPKMTNLVSSDGWTIFVGRNRNENDHLVNKVANPQDLWFHVLGQGGAHVLVRVPSNKQEPPKATILEAAQIAARLSKAGAGAKVRVVYTQIKHVKKIEGNTPGLVRYEQEKTVEVDTAQPMPKLMKSLFN